MKKSRLLFVVPKHTGALDSGAQQRTWLLARALSREVETDVLVLSANRATELDEARLQQTGVRNVHYLEREVSTGGIGSRLANGVFPYREQSIAAERFRELVQTGEYNGAVFRYLRTFGSVGDKGGLKTVVDVDDLDTQTVRSQGDVPDASSIVRLKARLRSAIMREPMLLQLRKAGSVWFCREADRKETGLENAFILPNLPLETIRAGGERRASPSHIIGFLGRMSWPVNIRGMDAFLQSCWPAVVSAVPQARMQIAGSGLSQELAAKWGRVANVEILGRVESVAEFYDRISFAVCPLFEGGGTKIKVLEALMHQRTVVIAAPSLAGYEDTLRSGAELLVGRDWGELTQACVRLLRDPELRERLELQGQETVRRCFGWDRFQEAVSAALRHTGL